MIDLTNFRFDVWLWTREFEWITSTPRMTQAPTAILKRNLIEIPKSRGIIPPLGKEENVGDVKIVEILGDRRKSART
jgi:hypothetical protein